MAGLLLAMSDLQVSNPDNRRFNGAIKPGGPVQVAPVFVLYGYNFRAPGTTSQAESFAVAYKWGVVCIDEVLLHPESNPDGATWCRARAAHTEQRLARRDPGFLTVLVSHWPLSRRPSEILRHPKFAQWCGTEFIRGWHTRYRAVFAVYGHLHVPRTILYGSVLFEEVSRGYPEEWRARSRSRPPAVCTVLPEAPAC
ncbi:metallophosphoesterase [Nocardioides sp. InS609-2]|uniref:metallophosphoesterase n=1 Tax=Nocardioides sp. InS609-2 TaxID=2760705 RepID=UPI0020BE5B22|nr:metallophosphoesterase [Nocardioides sp. InS609-2]